MKNILVALALLLSASVASAQVVAPGMRRLKFSGTTGIVGCQESTTTTPGSGGACNMLSAVAGNGAASTLTYLMNVRGYSTLGVTITYVYGNATSVTNTCYVSRDNNATYAQLDSTTITSGVGTNTPYADVVTGTASFSRDLRFDVRTIDWVKCVVSLGGSPTASDKITTQGIAAVGN